MEMIKHKIPLLVSTILLSQVFTAQAQQPDAETLVGNFYGGIHGVYLQADNDRLNGLDDKFDKGYGLGLEGGYRFNNPLELRLSYTSLKTELKKGADINGINKYALDLLYFPTHKNFYLLGGIGALNFDSETESAANLGLGYRHYFTEQFAGYVEAKAHHQFEGSYTDGLAQVGLIYFFGRNEKSIPIETSQVETKVESAEVVAKEEPVVAAAAVVAEIEQDSDNDGIVDSKDQCPTTPENDAVDEMGCTVFAEEKLSYRLSVNFDNNKSVVKPEYYEELGKVADFLKKYPHVEISVDGYSSSKGNAEYNKKLSQQRADSIASLLTSEYGIDATRMTPIGHGETNLIDERDTNEAHQKNRRIELNIDESHQVPVTR